MELVRWWKVVVLERYADFSGRSRPREYWMFVLANLIITWGGLLLGSLLASASRPLAFVVLAAVVLYVLATLVPQMAVGVRRLHDTNRTGWWLLIGLIPTIGFIVLIVLSALSGTPGVNDYGPNPAEATASGMRV